MTNKGNTMPAEKFNAPTQHDVYDGEKYVGPAYVYDASSWRNKNKRSNKIEDAKPELYVRKNVANG